MKIDLKPLVYLIPDFSTRVFRWLILFLLWILSIISLVTICEIIFADVKNYKFDLHPKGIGFFLNTFNDFYTLYAATIGIITLFLVIEQVRSMVIANIISTRAQWKDRFFLRLQKIEEKHPDMAIYFELKANEIYDFLIKTQLKILDEVHLKNFFKKFIFPKINDFEQRTESYVVDQNKKTLYPIGRTSYSYEFFEGIGYFLIIPGADYSLPHEEIERVYCSSISSK